MAGACEMSTRTAYETERGYPDLLDLTTALGNSKLFDRSIAPEIFQDFRVSYDFLAFVRKNCHWHDRHITYTGQELHKIAENFLGYKLGEDAFRVALYMHWVITKKQGAALTRVTVKAPNLSRVREFIPAWDQNVSRKEAA
jgi:hypothetical protein